MTSAVLECRDVSVLYQGLRALDEVSVALVPGAVTGIIGPNGAGKTTLINVLSGITVPSAGDVWFRGKRRNAWGLGRIARGGVARTFQASRVFPNLRVRENVNLACVDGRGALEFDPLELVNLGSRRDAVAGTLSYGETRLLGVAIALSAQPDVLLLDEPGAGLTGGDLTSLSASLRRISSAGTTILLVDHNLRFLMQTADRVVAMDRGRVVTEGSPEEVQDNADVRAAYLGRSYDA